MKIFNAVKTLVSNAKVSDWYFEFQLNMIKYLIILSEVIGKLKPFKVFKGYLLMIFVNFVHDKFEMSLTGIRVVLLY